MTILHDVSKLAKLHGVTIVVIQPDAPAAAAPQRSIRAHAINPNTAKTRAPRESSRGGPYALPKDPGPNATKGQRSNWRFAVWLTRAMNRHGISDAQLERSLRYPEGVGHVIRSGRSCGDERRAELREYVTGLEGRTVSTAASRPKRQPRLVQRAAPPGGYSMPNRNTQRTNNAAHAFGAWLATEMNKHGLRDEVVANSLDIPVGSLAQMRRGYYLPSGDRQRTIREWFASLKPGSQPEPVSAPRRNSGGGRRKGTKNGPPYSMPARPMGKGQRYEDAFQFGRWLTGNINEAGLSVSQLAELTGLSSSLISQLRAARWAPSNPTRAVLEALFNRQAQPTANGVTEEVATNAAPASV
jgi:ribosome-binding protein aMBF1 (putative translation factor)